METYGKILLIAMPIFLVSVFFEKWYGWKKGNDLTPWMDMISSLSSGVTNVVKSVLGLSIAIISYSWMVKHLAVVHLPSSILMYVVAFIVLDFAGYWAHRWNHAVNLFWNNHIVHHSSEEFNLACALRQSISELVQVFTFLLLPAAILGVPEKVVATVAPLHLFMQFWYHTRHVGKLGWLEHIIVTPSHHRVHHAINPEYLDKNLGQIFIFWDKWFGTFQEELPDKPPVYGITRPVATWNPIRINFQHVWLLIRDAWRTRNLIDKFRIWFMPTGWRPDDVARDYPLYKIHDVYHFDKYRPQASNALIRWSWFQLALTLLLISYLFANISKIGVPLIFYYGAFVYLQVYAFTDLMDRHAYAWVWELVKNVFGVYLVYMQGDWFGLNGWIPFGSQFMLAYFLFSTLVSFYFCRIHEVEGSGSQRVSASRSHSVKGWRVEE